jgi:hypothetical protein
VRSAGVLETVSCVSRFEVKKQELNKRVPYAKMKFIAIVERLGTACDTGAVTSSGSLGRGFESSELRPEKLDSGVVPEEATGA